MKNWNELIEKAKAVHGAREVSPFIDAGSVAAAILTADGNIYVGVSIDTSCSLGMCAERNAIANMITNGENEIERLVCLMRNGNLGLPCGACREYLMQLSRNSGNIEILIDEETEKALKLGDIIPEWWGTEKF